MNLYFAPMEGIGGYIYRNAQAEFFTKADKYFSPFISPAKERRIRKKEYRDVCPENNESVYLVPQILTNDAEAFCQTAEELARMGYAEVNLNLGCPSKTVVTKCRGAGFLAAPGQLDVFLGQIFEKTRVKISVKTRIGMEQPEEFDALLDIFRKYPIEELTIHPRVQADYYSGSPRMEAFQTAMERAGLPLVYNGDIFTVGDYKRRLEEILAGSPEIPADVQGLSAEGGRAPGQVSRLCAVMLGRGVLADPALFGEIRGSEEPDKKKLREFHDKLFADYSGALSGETNVLYKMKELWFYMAPRFTHYEKYAKQIRKSRRASDYQAAVSALFREQELDGRQRNM